MELQMESAFGEDTQVQAETPWQRIEQGLAPSDIYELGELSVGVDQLTEFIDKRYFEEYIADGGSKLKFITGRRGSI